MKYRVYQLVNRMTGLSYVGLTSNALLKTKLEFFENQKSSDQRKIIRAVHNYPDITDWGINEIYETPLEVEARMMQNAFIHQLEAVDNGYNSQCGEVDTLCKAVAHSIITGQEIQQYPFKRTQHPVHDKVWVFKFYNADDWSFGYQNEAGLWCMFGTKVASFDQACNEASHMFDNDDVDESPEFFEPIEPEVAMVKLQLSSEYGSMNEDYIDDIDKPTPLQSLSQIQSIISETHFCTEDDRNQFFNILCGLKGAA